MICASWFGASFQKDFLYPQFFQKMNKKIQLNYYDTSGWLVFLRLNFKFFQSLGQAVGVWIEPIFDPLED